MQRLGEAFSDDDKRDLVRRNFETGHVFYLEFVFSSGPRDKYALLVCPDPPPLFLLFNSEMAKFIEVTPRLKACQVPIKQETDPTAVKKDCYLDCTEVKQVSFEEVLRQVKDDPSRVRGTLCEETLKTVYMALQRDKRIVLGPKVRMIEALRPVAGLPPLN